MKPAQTKNRTPLAWTLVLIAALITLSSRIVFPEFGRLTGLFFVLFLGSLAYLVVESRKGMQGRAVSYGVNSIVTVLLVLGLVGVVNFMGARYPKKLDLTKDKLHTLSDQTEKVVKGLSKPVKAVLFSSIPQKEKFRPLLDNYKALNPKFEVEYVSPDREPTRTKQAGIKVDGTLQLLVEGREKRVEEPNEEKLTNAIISLNKEKIPTVCAITGHGERNFGGNDSEGYELTKKGLESQSYSVKDFNILTDSKDKKIPDTCDAVAIIGPTKAFFAPEIDAIRAYLANGGRAIVALDLNIKTGEFAPELAQLMSEWGVKPVAALVVDPISRMLNVDASVPVLPTFSKDSPITKDFSRDPAYFPIMRPLESLPATEGTTATWLAQTTPRSFEVTDLKSIATGQVNEDGKKHGPFNAAIAVERKGAADKDGKPGRKTRLVVFGSANFANNQWIRHGANQDLALNAFSWVLEDESLISIRSKEESSGRVELTQRGGSIIMLLTVFVIPLAIAIAGVVVWAMRRRL